MPGARSKSPPPGGAGAVAVPAIRTTHGHLRSRALDGRGGRCRALEMEAARSSRLVRRLGRAARSGQFPDPRRGEDWPPAHGILTNALARRKRPALRLGAADLQRNPQCGHLLLGLRRDLSLPSPAAVGDVGLGASHLDGCLHASRLVRRQIPVAVLGLSRRRVAVGNALVSGRELGGSGRRLGVARFPGAPEERGPCQRRRIFSTALASS